MELEKRLIEEDRLREMVEELGGEIVEGFPNAIYQDWTAHLHVDYLRAFAELVRQDERAACAALCDSVMTAQKCAQIIRARSST